ncbi:hypothetical protein K1719_007317 [Acacia pycnantha]|nr:hypothetical protein K1719_007317 [Acacia pycnantha]
MYTHKHPGRAHQKSRRRRRRNDQESRGGGRNFGEPRRREKFQKQSLKSRYVVSSLLVVCFSLLNLVGAESAVDNCRQSQARAHRCDRICECDGVVVPKCVYGFGVEFDFDV